MCLDNDSAHFKPEQGKQTGCCAIRQRSRAYLYRWVIVIFFNALSTFAEWAAKSDKKTKQLALPIAKLRFAFRPQAERRYNTLIFWHESLGAPCEGSFAGASFTLHIIQPRLKIKRPSSRTLALAYIILAKLDKRPGESPENAHSSFSSLRKAKWMHEYICPLIWS